MITRAALAGRYYKALAETEIEELQTKVSELEGELKEREILLETMDKEIVI